MKVAITLDFPEPSMTALTEHLGHRPSRQDLRHFISTSVRRAVIQTGQIPSDSVGMSPTEKAEAIVWGYAYPEFGRCPPRGAKS